MVNKMMITAIAACALAIGKHGWNKDRQIVPLGALYWQSAGGDDNKGTVGTASWYDLADWEIVKGSAASYWVQADGHVHVNMIDPAIGWGE
jgi:hypothetical protein